ncbi:mannosyltransferase [Actinosynnema sp. NPDC047251]|uniref:Mannosyltransferase n=1 Tax=Saccharothrix espanaensis (strain ATCC 51144 / DSM 44229 / JCM 9112 / NBRC 15066 / NRRL 15764) TaxID=1179773 RepID=K0JVF2_SACES|nr:mannosyltransferase [Saccharothrix espanaensis]CCH28158.1 Mannosyltransferase [Saccharothrix espanaensis DSM 44229]
MNLRAVEARVLAVAPWLFGLSLAGHLVMVAFQTQMTMIDLMVYRNGSPELFTGELYQWRLSEFSDKFALPFTYPPFAAFAFLPLSWISWEASRWVWQLLCLFCLWFLVRKSLTLVGSNDPRRAMLWTGLFVWVEPVRTTLNYGQINLVLAALLVGTVVSARPWVGGAGVGIAAGIKLTPAITGLYFLVTRNFKAAAWSIAAFGGTVGLGYLLSARQSNQFWFELLGDATRVGPVGSAINQSLRGALSRTVGYDVQTGPIFLVGALVAVGLAAWALHSAVRAKDTLAMLVAVQFLGLLVSPISWSHHWVWAIPALLWLVHGKARGPLVTATAWAWLLAIGSYLISILLILQESIWIIPRPWYLSLLGWVYPAVGLLTLVTIAVALRRRSPERVEHAVDLARQ